MVCACHRCTLKLTTHTNHTLPDNGIFKSTVIQHIAFLNGYVSRICMYVCVHTALLAFVVENIDQAVEMRLLKWMSMSSLE